MALTMKLRKLGDDGTLNYENIDIVPKRTFIRYQGIVSKLLSAEKISQISKSKTLKNKLKSEFLIGVIGTIYDQNYPDSLLEIVRGLRKRYPSKNIKIVIYSGNILKELPKENWIYVSRYKKTEQNRALLELDIIVNTWKAKPQIFSGSNKNLDAISLGIPLIAAKTPSYVEQLGEEYPLFYDFTEATTRFPSSIERQIWHHIESCFDDEYKERVQKYLLQRRLWRSHNVMRSLYKAQLEQLHQKKILIVVENFNVGGVQKYSRQIIECFSDFRVTIATSTTDDRAIEWVASMCCRVNIVLTQDFNIPLDDYDYAFLNSHPRDFQVLQELTIRLSKTKCKVYPIVHTDVHIFTQEVSHLLDYYSGIITVATKVTEKISTNKGISLRDKTHVITPVLNGGRSINSVPKTKRSKKIGYFGRMVRIKGVNFLVYAFAKLLREESIDYELHLYGPVAQESLKREIQATIKSLGGNSIFLHDEIIGAEERSRILCELDAVVYTTTMDGLPYTFLEAMELGTPILSTDVGGITNLIEDNVNGRIFRFNGLYIEDLYHKDPYNELAQIMSRQKDSYYLEFKRVLLDFVTNDEKFFAMSRNAITTVRRKFRNFNMYKSLMDIIYLD
jgi:glycosyltransferase involved in cell wall biosynthesis